jgi:sialate O-acetylesterase
MTSSEKMNLDVWVLAGQSNGEGCALLAGALAPDPRVLAFTSAGAWAVAEEPLHRHWESFTPVHQALLRPGLPVEKRDWTDTALAEEASRTRNQGAGLGLAFGRAMADATGRPVGLIPAAHGGTTLAQWSPDGKAQGPATLYGSMLERIHHAGGRLRGILWYQGEADAVMPESAASYGDRMATWIEAVRADLQIPELPVMVVQLARRALRTLNTPAVEEGWLAVRDAQAGLPGRIPFTATVGSLDLGLVDTVHLDTASQIRLGRRLATVALRVESLPGLACSPRMRRVETVPSQISGLGGLRIHCSGVFGALQPQHRMAGFSIHRADGSASPDCWVIEASRDPEEASAIQLVLNRQAEATDWIGYGRGADTYCNITDESDLPLLAGLLPCVQ